MKIKNGTYVLVVVISFVLGYVDCFSQGDIEAAEWKESESEYHARMKAWNDARFGLFMHWGVYATFGGEYNGTDHGKECANASAEHIFKTGDMPVEEYRQAARNFNPIHFDPDEWVTMAKDAGMKYMVLTAKHHDGFGLFDSKASDWNIVHASDYKKDLIKDYVDACHKQGMLVGFYYSHNADWFHNASSPRQSRSAPRPQSMEYKEFVMIQLKELLTQYGKIDILWFDTPSKTDIEFNKSCAAMVRKYQPECIINGRIGHDLGDYVSGGDRAVVEPGKQGYKESIMTMRLNWGYDKNDDFWKSSDELIAMLSQSACRGSNFMLNIGPTPLGTFPPEDRARLNALGKWMKINGEAIYSTEGSPFPKEYSWGSFTFNPDTRKVYLHLYNWTGGDITVEGIDSKVAKAYFLDNGDALEFSRNGGSNDLNISLPVLSKEKSLRIIALELEGDLKTDPANGPDFIPPTIRHLKFRKIEGTIKNLGPCEFQIDGKMTFSLNDQVRYRINSSGDIRKVLGFDLDEEKTYEVVYSPYPDEPVLEIITLLENER